MSVPYSTLELLSFFGNQPVLKSRNQGTIEEVGLPQFSLLQWRTFIWYFNGAHTTTSPVNTDKEDGAAVYPGYFKDVFVRAAVDIENF
mmetsp:Transcript_9660/g.20934  ORF Transcript_9660/g.20934 Transcript_9660/m.20934 type:complete len:88 (+) Transcript_9660:570-833(+)